MDARVRREGRRGAVRTPSLRETRTHAHTHTHTRTHALVLHVRHSCARKLSPLVHDWVCFNDKEVSTRVYEAGAGTLRRLLHRRYGTFSGAEWSASPSAAAAEEAEETRAEQASRMPSKPPHTRTRGSHHHHHHHHHQSLPCYAGRALSPGTCGVHHYHYHPNPTNPTVPCLLAWRANHA